MKQILREVLGKTLFCCEEMSTVLCDAESITISRPLTKCSENESEYIVLSPSTFLTDFRQTDDENFLNKRLKYQQILNKDARKKFMSEYLGLLIQIKKYERYCQQIKLVIL